MKILTIDAKITCKHITGVAQLVAQQFYVTVEGRPILIANDPERKPITGCANVGLTIKPCTFTLPVTKGYSSFVKINGRPICLDTVTGFTDGTPPGVVKYIVRDPGQKLVTEKS